MNQNSKHSSFNLILLPFLCLKTLSKARGLELLSQFYQIREICELVLKIDRILRFSSSHIIAFKQSYAGFCNELNMLEDAFHKGKVQEKNKKLNTEEIDPITKQQLIDPVYVHGHVFSFTTLNDLFNKAGSSTIICPHPSGCKLTIHKKELEKHFIPASPSTHRRSVDTVPVVPTDIDDVEIDNILQQLKEERRKAEDTVFFLNQRIKELEARKGANAKAALPKVVTENSVLAESKLFEGRASYAPASSKSQAESNLPFPPKVGREVADLPPLVYPTAPRTGSTTKLTASFTSQAFTDRSQQHTVGRPTQQRAENITVRAPAGNNTARSGFGSASSIGQSTLFRNTGPSAPAPILAQPKPKPKPKPSRSESVTNIKKMFENTRF